MEQPCREAQSKHIPGAIPFNRPWSCTAKRRFFYLESDVTYQKRVQHDFEVDGEELSITSFNEKFACIEETRKNGQEDSHMQGVLAFVDGSFVWDEDEGENFSRYHSERLADGIVEYINKNGLPKEDGMS